MNSTDITFEVSNITNEIFFTDAPVRKSFSADQVSNYSRIQKYSLTAEWKYKNAAMYDTQGNKMVFEITSVSMCEGRTINFLVTHSIHETLSCYRINATITDDFRGLYPLEGAKVFLFVDGFFGVLGNLADDLTSGFNDIGQGFSSVFEDTVQGWNDFSYALKRSFEDLGVDLLRDLERVGTHIESGWNDVSEIGEEVVESIGEFLTSGVCTTILRPIILSLTSGDKTANVEDCVDFTVDGAETCETLGLGFLDPAADACAAIVGGMFGTGCGSIIESINKLLSSRQGATVIAKTICHGL